MRNMIVRFFTIEINNIKDFENNMNKLVKIIFCLLKFCHDKNKKLGL